MPNIISVGPGAYQVHKVGGLRSPKTEGGSISSGCDMWQSATYSISKNEGHRSGSEAEARLAHRTIQLLECGEVDGGGPKAENTYSLAI